MDELLRRIQALEFAVWGGSSPEAPISTESMEGRLRDVETVAHSAEGEIYADSEEERRRPIIEDDLAAAKRIESRVVAREPATESKPRGPQICEGPSSPCFPGDKRTS